ncbi:MAG TPA: NAD(P)H-hydrate dehydratase [Bacteroidia bacterium]|nr:NAD(P)H-hydrate dehydratase [Bacteroidia bacterium]
MKILSAEQTRAVDAFTIQNEPIAGIDLMERAAMACFRRLIKLIRLEEEVIVFCGKGNNGGDGLAIARLLIEQGFDCKTIVVNYKEHFSPDAEINFKRLIEKYQSRVLEINSAEALLQIGAEKNTVIIDALTGTGISKALEGLLAEVIIFLNKNFKKIISIDLPSGLFPDASSKDNKAVVRSALTLTLQLPKLAMMMAENKKYVPEFEILDIGLNASAIEANNSGYHYVTKKDISTLLKPRDKFSHKGQFGHALLLAGSKGKSGAALISARACLRSGAGLLTVHSTLETLNALSIALPEAMSEQDPRTDFISEVNHPENYEAIAFGPGVGLEEDTQLVLKKILQYYTGKLLIDADGLNILSENKTWLTFLPPNSILTPHPKEFERLTEKHEDDFEQLKAAKHFSMKNNCIVVLKGAHTAIVMPDGNVFFNSSGNPGLAKGGSGDGLTGIILGLLSRGYNEPKSALIGTFIHGFAADLCIGKKSMESLLISDVIETLGKAFKKLEK